MLPYDHLIFVNIGKYHRFRMHVTSLVDGLIDLLVIREQINRSHLARLDVHFRTTVTALTVLRSYRALSSIHCVIVPQSCMDGKWWCKIQTFLKSCLIKSPRLIENVSKIFKTYWGKKIVLVLAATHHVYKQFPACQIFSGCD